MIHFLEDTMFGYKSRTAKNATADATIAIAVDFNTAGERLTKQLVINQKNKYIAVPFKTMLHETARVVNMINTINRNEIILNIAGNGIYTLGKYFYNQDMVDELVYLFIKDIINSSELTLKIKGIRTGGQTGIDEAGAKAGVRLHIPTLVLAPKGWKFRKLDGVDIANEQEFKQRFIQR